MTLRCILRRAGAPQPWALPPILVGLAVLAAFTLRLYRISAQSLWYDEAYSLWLTQGDVTAVLQRIIAVDNHPPLFTLLLKGMVHFAGDSELAVRAASVLAGTLATAAMARLGGRVGGWPLAAVAAWLVALSPFYVLYGQEARAYAVSLLLGVLLLDTALRCLRTARLLPWATLGALALMALYTHYATAMLVAALGLGLALNTGRAVWLARSPRLLLGPALAAGIATAGYVPWLPYALRAVRRDNSYYEGSLALLPVLNGLWAGFAGAINLDGAPHPELVPWAVGFGALALLGALWPGWHKRQTALIAVLSALVLPVAAYALLQQLVPKFHPRYLISVTPAAYLLAGAGLLLLWRWRSIKRAGPVMAAAAVALLLSAWAPLLVRYYDGELGLRQDWRGVSRVLASERRPEEPLVVLAGYGQLPLAHYLPGQALVALPDTPLPVLNRMLGMGDLRALQSAIDGSSRMWLVEWQSPVMDPSSQLEQALRSASRPLSDRNFQGIRLRSLALTGYPLTPPAMGEGLSANFAELIVLESAQLPAVPVPSAGSLPVRLHWRTLQEPQHNYKVALRLLDQQRREWGRLDTRPAGELNFTRRWTVGAEFAAEVSVPVRPGTPPGEYTLELQLYDEETLAQVPAVVGTRPGSPLVNAGSVRIAGAATDIAALGALTRAGIEGSGVRLLGYRLAGAHVPAGESIQLTLAWEALGGEPTARVRLEALGFSSAAQVLPPAAGRLTHPGDRFLSVHTVTTPPEANGEAQVSVWLDGGLAFTVPVTVQGRSRQYQPPPVGSKVHIPFGESLQLYGYTLGPTPVRAGDALDLRLVWRPLTRPQSRLKVFVHLVDSSGFPVAQHDSEPVDNTLPTLRWAAGEYVEDIHRVRLPAHMPSGAFALVVGLYHWPDGSRLPAADADAYRIPTPVVVERR